MLKLTMIFMLATVALTEGATDSCVAEATLKEFGFEPKALEVVESPTYCTDVFKTPGRCITADTIKAFIEKKETENTTAHNGFVQIDKDFNTFFGNIGSTFSDLWDKITSNEAEKTWKDKMAEVTKKATDSVNKCFMSYNQVTHGVSCFLASGAAGQKTSIAAKKVTINATNSIHQVVTDCLDTLSAICLFFKGGEEAKLDTAQSADQKTLCTEHSDYQKCMIDGGNTTSCMTDARKEKIFNLMYSFTANKWMPDATKVSSVTDTIVKWFEGAKDKVFSWFKPTEGTAARILEEVASVEFKIVTENGADLWAIGGKSGLEKKGVNVYAWAIVSVMIAMFFRLK